MSDKESFFKRFQFPSKSSKEYFPADLPTDFFQEEEENNVSALFAQRLKESGGEFYFAQTLEELSVALSVFLVQEKIKTLYCTNEILLSLFNNQEFNILNDKDNLENNEATITECEFLCARTGTVVMSSFLSTGRRAIFANDILIVIAQTSQVVADIYDAIDALMTKYGKNTPSLITFVTGPSRTADIEKQLVLGAHGAKRLVVFLYE